MTALTPVRSDVAGSDSDQAGSRMGGTRITTGLQEIYTPQLRQLDAADSIPRTPADRRLRNRNWIVAVCPV